MSEQAQTSNLSGQEKQALETYLADGSLKGVAFAVVAALVYLAFSFAFLGAGNLMTANMPWFGMFLLLSFPVGQWLFLTPLLFWLRKKGDKTKMIRGLVSTGLVFSLLSFAALLVFWLRKGA